MTFEEFNDYCEEIALDENELNAITRAQLDNIAKEIGEVAIDFSGDTEMLIDACNTCGGLHCIGDCLLGISDDPAGNYR